MHKKIRTRQETAGLILVSVFGFAYCGGGGGGGGGTNPQTGNLNQRGEMKMKTVRLMSMLCLTFALIFCALDMTAQELEFNTQRGFQSPESRTVNLGRGQAPEKCRDLCVKDPKCKCFSYRMSDGTCSMNNVVQPPLAARGFVSGIISRGATASMTNMQRPPQKPSPMIIQKNEIKIKKVCPPLAFTSTSPLPPTSVGADYTYQLKTSGGVPPINFYLPSTGEGGIGYAKDIPYGLSLSSSGLIKGQLVGTPARNYFFEVVAIDKCENGSQRTVKTFYLLVKPE